MKVSSYIKPKSHPIVKIFASLGLLTALTVSCAGGEQKSQESLETSGTEAAEDTNQAGATGFGEEGSEDVAAKDDNSMIVQAILDHQKMDGLLTEDMAPINIFNKKFKSLKVNKFGQPAVLLTKKDLKEKKGNVLVFKRFNIKDHTAKVSFTHKASGKKGKFSLEKAEDGKWMVKKAQISKAKPKKKKKKKDAPAEEG